MDTARNSVRILWTPGRVSRTFRDGTKPHDCGLDVRSPRDNGPVLIGVIFVLPTMWHSVSQDVLNKRQSTSPSVSRNTQNFDASVDGISANDRDSTDIFRKVLGRELFDSLGTEIYSRCWVDFTSNVVVTEAPDFVHLGLPDVNALDEFSTFGTPATRVRRPIDGSH